MSAKKKPDAHLSGLSKAKGKPRGKPFPKGRSGNPGGVSPQKREVLAILKEKGEVFATKLIELAEAGNVEAVKTGLAYLVGKPKERLEVSGPDDGPLEIDITGLSANQLAQLDRMLGKVVKDEGEEG